MALELIYNVEIQTTRKVLTVIDASNGWNTANYELPNYYINNPSDHEVRLKVAIETKCKVIAKNFVLTHGVNYDAGANPDDDEVVPSFGTQSVPVATNDELRFSLLLSFTGDLVLINDLTNIDNDDYDVLPDGIYTIEYIVDSGTDLLDPIVYKEEFVVTSAAEQVVEDQANAIADSILTCRDTNVDMISDYLVSEGLLFAASKAAFISRKNRILNILDVLNQD